MSHAAFKRIYVQNSGTAFEDDSSDLTTIPDKTVQFVNAGNSTVNTVAPGSAIDVSADGPIEDFDEIRIAFRDGDFLDQSPVIDVDELEVSDLTYSRPSQQVTTLDFPSAPSSDEFWTVKVTDLESGNQPFPRRSNEIEVLSSWTNQQIVENFIDAINDNEDQINDFQGTSVYAGVEYDTNATVELSGLANGDTFDLTIEGTTYSTEEVATDEEQTFRAFISEHGDTILRNHGVTFRIDSNDSDLIIYQAEGYDLTLTDAGDLDATVTGTGTATLNDASMSSRVLRLTAKDVGDIFDVATRNFTPDSVTVQWDPTDGVGTPAQIERYEADDDGTLGRYVESTNLLGSLPGPATYVQNDGEYDLLTFTFEGDSEKAVNKSIANQTYVVALESAVIANSTNFDSFLSSVTVASDR